MPQISVTKYDDDDEDYLRWMEQDNQQQQQKQQQKQLPNEQYLNRHLESTTITEWFNMLKEGFTKQIFPQHFVPYLVENYGDSLFSRNDLEKFNILSSQFGDLNNPSDRERVYEGQCQYLHEHLHKKILSTPSHLLQLINALKHKNWYESLAQSFTAYLSKWYKNSVQYDNDDVYEFGHSLSPSSSLSPSHHSGSRNTSINTSHTTVTRTKSPPIKTKRKPLKRMINVPEPIRTFVNREEKCRELINHLRELSKEAKGWLILYGMSGSGKTVLAANTIRALEMSHFTDGIYWINCGDLRKKTHRSRSSSSLSSSSSSWSLKETNELLQKLELLSNFIHLFHGKHVADGGKFSDLETAKMTLQCFFEQHHKSLLILDDVCNDEVLQWFQLKVPVLVITQDKNMVKNNQHLSPIKFIPIMKTNNTGEVLQLQESLELLFKFLPDDVPRKTISDNDVVRQLLKHSNGLPFVVAQIAICMERYYCDFYDANEANTIEFMQNNIDDQTEQPIDPCKTKWDDLYHDLVQTRSNLTIDDGNEMSELKENCIALAGRSIEALNDELRERLYDFVIFYESVPYSVLCTLWWKDIPHESTIKSTLEKLVNKCLLIKSIALKKKPTIFMNDGGDELLQQQSMQQTLATIDVASYSLHSMTFTYLESKLSSDDIRKRHAKLVNNYLYRYCHIGEHLNNAKFDYARLPYDDYIYHNLAYHLSSAGLGELLTEIYLDLNFIQHKIAQTGPSDLLEDYVAFEHNFLCDEFHRKKKKNFRHFIAQNCKELWDISGKNDSSKSLLQMALCEPTDSYVYQNAAKIISQLSSSSPSSSSSYFLSPTSSSLSQSKSKFYFEFCNKQNNWVEHEKFLSFHCATEVNHAAYSPDAQYIVTVSGRMVQLFNGNTGKLVAHNESHNDQINHCAFSHDGKLLLTCAEDGIAKLWKMSYWKASTTALGNITLNESNNDINAMSTSGGDEQQTLSQQQQKKYRQRHHSGNGSSVVSALNKSRTALNEVLEEQKLFDVRYIKMKHDATAAGRNWFDKDIALKCGDISQCGKLVLTGNSNRLLHLWSVKKTEQIHSIALTTDTNNDDADGNIVECCAFSPDNRFIFGLVGCVVYVFSIVSTENLNRSQQNIFAYSSSDIKNFNRRYSVRQDSVSPHPPAYVIKLNRKLEHEFKVYNAVFNQSNSNDGSQFSIIPATLSIFTSSNHCVCEWDIPSCDIVNVIQRSKSIMDDSDDDNDDFDWSAGQEGEEERKNVTKNSTKQQQQTKPIRRYSHSHSHSHLHVHFAPFNNKECLSYVAVSKSGQYIAAFEHTRNIIYVWYRKHDYFFHKNCGSGRTLNKIQCQSDIVALSFSKEDRLLGVCRNGAVTVWNIEKINRSMSDVELKKTFSISPRLLPPACPERTMSTIKEYDDLLHILTIDVHGFPRLFQTLSGIEDKEFSHLLREKLKSYQLNVNDLITSHDSKERTSPPQQQQQRNRLDIVSCAISETADRILLGTSVGDVFHYTLHSSENSAQNVLDKYKHWVNESVVDCEFVPALQYTTVLPTQVDENKKKISKPLFITQSNSCITFFSESPPPSLSSSPSHITTTTTTTSLTPYPLKIQDIMKMIFGKHEKQSNSTTFVSFKFLPRLGWIIIWTDQGILLVLDYINNQMVEYFKHKSYRITSVSFSTPVDTPNQVMLVSTTSKTIYVYLIKQNTNAQTFYIKLFKHKIDFAEIPRCCQISPNISYIVTGFDSGDLSVNNTKKDLFGETISFFKGVHSTYINDLAISPDENFFLTASDCIKLWGRNCGYGYGQSNTQNNQRLQFQLLRTFITKTNVSQMFVRFCGYYNVFVSQSSANGDGDDDGGDENDDGAAAQKCTIKVMDRNNNHRQKALWHQQQQRQHSLWSLPQSSPPPPPPLLPSSSELPMVIVITVADNNNLVILKTFEPTNVSQSSSSTTISVPPPP